MIPLMTVFDTARLTVKSNFLLIPAWSLQRKGLSRLIRGSSGAREVEKVRSHGGVHSL